MRNIFKKVRIGHCYQRRRRRLLLLLLQGPVSASYLQPWHYSRPGTPGLLHYKGTSITLLCTAMINYSSLDLYCIARPHLVNVCSYGRRSMLTRRWYRVDRCCREAEYSSGTARLCIVHSHCVAACPALESRKEGQWVMSELVVRAVLVWRWALLLQSLHTALHLLLLGLHWRKHPAPYRGGHMLVDPRYQPLPLFLGIMFPGGVFLWAALGIHWLSIFLRSERLIAYLPELLTHLPEE